MKRGVSCCLSEAWAGSAYLVVLALSVCLKVMNCFATKKISSALKTKSPVVDAVDIILMEVGGTAIAAIAT